MFFKNFLFKGFFSFAFLLKQHDDVTYAHDDVTYAHDDVTSLHI